MKTIGRVGIVLASCLLLSIAGCVSQQGGSTPKRDQQIFQNRKLTSNANLTIDLGSDVAMKFVGIPAGKFTMGAPESEQSRIRDEWMPRQVTITRAFHMGVTEVTQAQWRAVMGTRPWDGKPSVKVGADNAASWISWDNAMAFCMSLSRKTGWFVRLPTEAEWEYACRAGTSTRFHHGDDPNDEKLDAYAWFADNADKKGQKYAHAVAQKKPNAWGLYDMHGNVFEWCSDWWFFTWKYEPKTWAPNQSANRDPKGPKSGRGRVLRGGSWNVSQQHCRAAHRIRSKAHRGCSSYGFRVVIESTPCGN